MPTVHRVLAAYFTLTKFAVAVRKIALIKVSVPALIGAKIEGVPLIFPRGIVNVCPELIAGKSGALMPGTAPALNRAVRPEYGITPFFNP
jgi:hypothetical protein